MSENMQPQIGIVAAEVSEVLAQVDSQQIKHLLQALHTAARVFVAGAGRSGLVMRMFAMRLMQTGKTVYVAGDTVTPAIAAGDLLLIASGSGKTATLLTLAATAKRCGAGVALLSYTNDSTLAQDADVLLEIPVPLDSARPGGGGVGGRQPMASLFEQCALLVCDALCATYCHANEIPYADLADRHANLE